MIAHYRRLFLFLFAASQPTVLFAACADLLAVTPSIGKYASDIAATFKTGDSAEDKVKAVIAYMHGKNGIGTANFSPDIFIRLHTAFKGGKITRPEEAAKAIGLPKTGSAARTAYNEIYDKYAVPDFRGVFFAPTASDIIEHRMAFGCTHYARAFIAIAKALKLFSPADMRYVIASSHKDYGNACPVKSSQASGITINGHQFVLLRYNSHWWFVNTSNKDFEKVPAATLNYLENNLIVRFPSYAKNSNSGHNMLLVRYIGESYDDGACDNSFDRLMNISASGKIDSDICLWKRY